MDLSEKIKLCFALLAIHMAASTLTTIPGYLSIDEILYHLMSKNFMETASFEIWNGYREFPSPELVFPLTSVHNGRLVSQYPYLYPILSTPFYALSGYRGLFLFNATAFLGVVILTYTICQKLFQNKNTSINACLILSLATYAWEYSQAAWPHMVSAFFVMASFSLFLSAFNENDPKKSFFTALACGIISGLSVGIRLDSILILPCFIFAFLFLKPWRPRLCFGVIAGSVPGLILLGATNYAKFGTVSPFSYGSHAETKAGVLELAKYFPLIVLCLALFAVLWVATRYPAVYVIKKYRKSTIFLFLLPPILLFMVPEIKTMIWKTFNGAYQLLIDFRIRDFDIQEGGLSRSMGGGMVYLGGLKKSLLQSCPYLVILVIPILKIIKCHKNRLSLILLFLIPVTYIAFYSYSGGWHGGLCLNLRYFVPVLPFLSILTAFSWDNLTAGMTFSKNRRSELLVFLFLCNIILILFFYFGSTLTDPDAQEFYCLNLPLFLACTSLALLLIYQMSAKVRGLLLYRTTVTVLLFSMIWAGTIGFAYDYHMFHREKRRSSYENSALAAKFISGEAVLFTNRIESLAGLMENNNIRIANPFHDEFQDVKKLVAFHFHEGNNVYLAFHPARPEIWHRLNNLGLRDEYEIRYFEKSKSLILGQLVESEIFQK